MRLPKKANETHGAYPIRHFGGLLGVFLFFFLQTELRSFTVYGPGETDMAVIFRSTEDYPQRSTDQAVQWRQMSRVLTYIDDIVESIVSPKSPLAPSPIRDWDADQPHTGIPSFCSLSCVEFIGNNSPV